MSIPLTERDCREIRRCLPPEELKPHAHAALRRLSAKARRFDRALDVLARAELPNEYLELVAQIKKEISG